MKRLFSILVLVLFIAPNINGQLSGYQDRIINAMLLIENGDTLSDNILIDCIPKSDTNFSEFYALTYHEYDTLVNINTYYKLNDTFFKTAESGNNLAYKYLLEMSMFVDGEYAESYYDNIEALISFNKPLFCAVFAKLDPTKTEKLIEYYNDFCK